MGVGVYGEKKPQILWLWQSMGLCFVSYKNQISAKWVSVTEGAKRCRIEGYKLITVSNVTATR